MGSKRAARRETRRKTKYGLFEVTSRSGHSRQWYVEDYDGEEFHVGKRKNGKKRAKALAAALDAADIANFESVLPPEAEPSRHSDSSEWEGWSADSYALPAEMLADSNYSAAGYLHGIYNLKPSYIARRIGVSEQSVRQYLSDLRAGRRSNDYRTTEPESQPEADEASSSRAENDESSESEPESQPEAGSTGSNPTPEADEDGSGDSESADSSTDAAESDESSESESESEDKSETESDTESELPSKSALDVDWPTHTGAGFLEGSFKELGEKRAYNLWNAGVQSYEDVLEADVMDLRRANGVGEKTAEKIKIQMAGIGMDKLDLERSDIADMETETIAETLCLSEDLAERLKNEINHRQS